MLRLLDYSYIAATIVLTVYGQLAIKWRIAGHLPLPEGLTAKVAALLSLLADPVIFSGFAAAFLAALAWMMAMTRFELSHAYPFMALNFAAVLVLSGWLLGEPVTTAKCLGVALIMVGTAVASRG